VHDLVAQDRKHRHLRRLPMIHYLREFDNERQPAALDSELIDGGSFDELCRRINEMLMLEKLDEFGPEISSLKDPNYARGQANQATRAIDQRCP
jgi:hypothetical protein